MEFFLIWIVSIIIGCLIGGSKGRFMSGFVWSFLLGPLGVLIVLCLKNLEAEKKDKEREAVMRKHMALQEAQVREMRELNMRHSDAPISPASTPRPAKKTIRLSKNGEDLGDVDIPSAKLAVRAAGGLEGFYYFDFSASDWVSLAAHPEFLRTQAA